MTKWAGRADYLRARRADRRQKLIVILGEVCVRCGTRDDLQIDHKEPGSRSFLLSGDGMDRRWEDIILESLKCQLLCGPCHRDKSLELGEHAGGHNKNHRPLVHGSTRCYQEMPCRCPRCKTAKQMYRSRQIGYEEVLAPIAQ
jgi:hypothetical protein